MLLAFDVGNTNTMIGIFDSHKLISTWRIETSTKKSADEYGMVVREFCSFAGIETSDVDAIIISTVVPYLVFTLKHMAYKYFGIIPIVIEPGIKTGLVIKFDDPKQVGGDQISNAVAAIKKYGGPLIVVDFGTATSFCAVSEKNEYIGGVLSPGLKIASDSLFNKAAMLPKVELEKPDKIIGSNTVESIQAGLVYGHMGLVDFIIKKMKEEMRTGGKGKDITVIGTGGLANLIAGGLDSIDVVDRNLTLEGLQIIYQKNKHLIKKRQPEKKIPREERDEYAGR
jgi:type III pantothenate kinase